MGAVYPFTAIIGQESMKQALILAAVDPHIGGVLVFGERGTGKSTSIRALASTLPRINVVANCRYQCDPEGPRLGLCGQCSDNKGTVKAKRQALPVVDLPLGATEDRVVGALDIERALHHGEKVFEPGLLAAANRGFLYVDEVNLLEDHIVDTLLDVAASGENLVEREGLSIRHPARFVLVGSGNPEEGELRPQLLDRFGLSVDVKTPKDVATRVDIILARDEFDRDPEAFERRWRRKENALRRRIELARGRLDDIDMPAEILELAASLCITLGTDGLRGELTLIRAARATAALNGRDSASIADLKAVAPMVLRHRLRRDPLDESSSDVRVERAIEALFNQEPV